MLATTRYSAILAGARSDRSSGSVRDTISREDLVQGEIVEYHLQEPSVPLVDENGRRGVRQSNHW